MISLQICFVYQNFILEADTYQSLEFSEDILSIYLDSFDPISMTTISTDDDATDDDTELSAGAIAGIVIATIAVVIFVMVVVLAVGRSFCHFYLCHKQSSSV